MKQSLVYTTPPGEAGLIDADCYQAQVAKLSPVPVPAGVR
jgi:hypothetical protein